MTISSLSLFCEDIRNEVGGLETLVGIFPDNIAFSKGFPSTLAKFGIYTRISFDVNKPPKFLRIRIVGVEGEIISDAEMDEELIAQAVLESKKSDSPLAGVKQIALASPLVVKSKGRIIVYLVSEKEETIAGILNFI